MKKSIVWITAGCFVDVDVDVVPALSKEYDIHWYIWGGMSKGDAKRMANIPQSEHLRIGYLACKQRWYSPMIYFEYRKILKSVIGKGDLLYVDYSGNLCFYQALYSVCDINKTVLAIHNVKTPKGARYEWLARYNTLYAVRHFRNIQTFSHNQHEYLDSLAKDKNVLEAPLMLKDYGLAKKERTDMTFNFLTFGHIRGYKRVDLLIEAAQELAKRTEKKFKVTIVGNCKNWSQYESLVTNPSIFDIQIGFVENENIPQYFNDADFFVLPYQDLAQSGAITVAFQYNVPVITSDIVQFKEYNGSEEYGLMFESCNSKALALAMERALNMSEMEICNMKAAQRVFVENTFSARSILSKYIAYLDRL